MSFLLGEHMTGGYGAADILHDCSIGVEKGEIAVIVGPNGAGKSTAMKAVFGMLPLRKGRILFVGSDVTAVKPEERVVKGMGFVPQTHNVFTSMTVEENLEMGAFIRTDSISDSISQVYDLFPILKEKRKQPAGELSGGQRQRIAIGRALATKPEFIVADEPVSALDVTIQAQILDLLKDLKDEYGLTMLFVSHDLAVIRQIADRVAGLYRGKLEEVGNTSDVFNSPQSDYTQRLLAAIPGKSAA